MSLNMLILFALAGAGLYYICPARARWLLLLALSYAFYAYHGLSALPFLLLTTLSTWAGALLIGRIGAKSKSELKEKRALLTAEEKKRLKAAAKSRQRALLLAVLLVNFGALGVFKYADPLLDTLFRATGAARESGLNLLLPLGISFYTFQSAGYLLDVYNGKLLPERNPLRFALFVSFFPQLIQGPIARYDQLAQQLTEPHRFDLTRMQHGLLLMLWGFFKKKVIADRALPLVAEVFGNQSAYGGAAIMTAVLFYSLQQYADFSGGIDLVTGIAQLYGVRLAPNFKRPYFAVSLGDFWRRWHISLGAWMRDYVFYPFALAKPVAALSRAAKKRFGAGVSRALPAALGNILVFTLVGVWHGAQMGFILWGLYNGLVLAASALLDPAYRRFDERHAGLVKSRGFHLLRVLRTFLVVNIGWYFDRCERAGDAFAMLARSVTDLRAAQLADSAVLARLGLTGRDWGILLIATLILFAVSLAQERGVKVRDWVLARPLPVRWLLLLTFILFVLGTHVISGAGTDSFMYAVF
ncbi:MAG: MBOAT family O-acyltransferase [Clostridia bacterium]|nr:MBOAT family O-acyltransferase [Clostridia bacterium]